MPTHRLVPAIRGASFPGSSKCFMAVRPCFSYADIWMQAADAAGYGLCVSIGQFDPNGLLINGTERVVHNPTLWNGTGRPDWYSVGGTHSLPSSTPGTPATCYTWNGKDWVMGKTPWPGTVASPALLDQTEQEVRDGAPAALVIGCLQCLPHNTESHHCLTERNCTLP